MVLKQSTIHSNNLLQLDRQLCDLVLDGHFEEVGPFEHNKLEHRKNGISGQGQVKLPQNGMIPSVSTTD